MPIPHESPRPRHLLPGTPVHHNTYGDGKVIGEWGPVIVSHGEGTRASCSCDGIYDCVFGVEPHRFMHCCRAEYLQRIQWITLGT